MQPLTSEGALQEEAVGILLLMADIYSEADHPCSALPYALSAWLHATELGMDLKVPHPDDNSAFRSLPAFGR